MHSRFLPFPSAVLSFQLPASSEGGTQLRNGRPGAERELCGSCSEKLRELCGSCAEKLRELCGKAAGGVRKSFPMLPDGGGWTDGPGYGKKHVRGGSSGWYSIEGQFGTTAVLPAANPPTPQ